MSFGVLAGWLDDELRELRGEAGWLKGWLAGDVVSHARRSERSADILASIRHQLRSVNMET